MTAIQNFFIGRSNIGRIQFIDDINLVVNNQLIDLESGVTIDGGIVKVNDPNLKGKRGVITIIVPNRLLNIERIVVYRDGVKCQETGDVTCRITNKLHVDTNNDSVLDSTSISFEVSSL